MYFTKLCGLAHMVANQASQNHHKACLLA